MKILSENELDHVQGGGLLSQIDEAYQYLKEAGREFWRGLKEGADLE